MNTLIKTVVLRLALVTGLLAALAVPASAQTAETGSYGYLRVVEGSATLTPDGGERAAAEMNQPVLAGDHLFVPDRSHVEIVLADHNLLRVDGGSELVVERQAGETGRDDQATVIRLIEGNVQLAVLQESLGDQLPRIDTPNATLYIKNYGVYRITTESDGYSQIVVRRGTAEVVADQDRQPVRAGEQAGIESGNGQQAGIDIRQAGAADSLERWARRLDDEAAAVRQADNSGALDDNLGYQASSLASYGSWVDVEGTRYWRPRVEAGWRPYWHGRWAYTPAGLTWIAYEPWGWVPFHYGTWNYVDTYGWVWQPGYVWSPAWVYWYWGPTNVGWCPTGFYTSFYGSRFGGDVGFRSGVYGWAGGNWGLFDRWSFVSTSYFHDGYRAGYRQGYWDGRRELARYAVPIDRLRGAGLERGVITTDTKPLRPNTWRDQGAVLHALNVRPDGPQGSHNLGSGREVPDVTQFMTRKPQLPTDVVRTVSIQGAGHTLDGTPFKPGTLGRPSRDARGAGTAGATGAGNGRGPGDRTWSRNGTTADAPGTKPGRTTGTGTTVDNDRPRGERPGRPAPSTDGGAPKPRNVPGGVPGDKADRPAVDNGRPTRTNPPPPRDRTDRPATTDDNKRDDNRRDDKRRPPADNGRPAWKRPDARPDAETGSPKPGPSRDSRDSRDQDKTRVEPKREPTPTRDRAPEKPKSEPKREPEKPKEKPQPPPPRR